MASTRFERLNLMVSRVVSSKAFWITCFILVVFLTTGLVCFSKTGFMHLFRMKRELYELEKQNSEISSKNRMLFNKIRLFTNNRLLQEEAIRKELGWVKDGEIVIDFPKTTSGNEEDIPLPRH